MKLILTRHGETEENKNKILQGHLPGKLSELGKEQAKKVALRLKDENIDVIYSSDLARAADTAKEIATYHKNIPIHFVEELREKDLGEYTGKSWNEIESFDAIINNDYSSQGVETRERMTTRLKDFLKEVFAKHKNQTVLFVAHNGTTKVLLRTIIQESQIPFEKLEDQHNTAVNIICIEEDKNHNLEVLNCKKHLDD